MNRKGQLCAIVEEDGCSEMSASEKSNPSPGKSPSKLDDAEVEEDQGSITQDEES